jgi:hypothetical protein
MVQQIRDGAGTGMLAKVNGNQRLYTQSISVSEDFQATKSGRSYNVNSGVITLTNDTETPLIYLKNNDTEDLHITAIAIGVGPTTGGSGGIPKITVIRNPTTGTIIESTPTDVDILSNRNYGSSDNLVVDAYKGATGDTMTNGEDHIIFFQNSSGRLFASIDEVLTNGDSIGIKFDPQSGNTSQDVYAALICHLEDANE